MRLGSQPVTVPQGDPWSGLPLVSMNRQPAPKGSQVCVYLIRAADATGLTKIGWTRQIEWRLRDLQTGCPILLTVVRRLELRSIPQARKLEKQLHQQFAAKRIHGEWFDLTTHELNTIVAAWMKYETR